jgi:hypothetical protein
MHFLHAHIVPEEPDSTDIHTTFAERACSAQATFNALCARIRRAGIDEYLVFAAHESTPIQISLIGCHAGTSKQCPHVIALLTDNGLHLAFPYCE